MKTEQNPLRRDEVAEFFSMAKIFQSRNVCFTSFSEDPPKWNAVEMVYLVFQREVSPTTGKEHWQGFCQFKNPRRLASIKNLLGLQDAHVEAMRGTPQQAADYCKKKESRKEGGLAGEYGELRQQGKRNDLVELKRLIFEENYTRPMLMMEEVGLYALAHCSKLVDEMIALRDQEKAKAELKASMEKKADPDKFPWQRELCEVLEDTPASDRTVFWVWEARGNAGKSFWANMMALELGAIVMAPNTPREMAYIWAQRQAPLVIVDVSRTMQKEDKWDPMRGSFEFVECLKNGRVLSTKYESRVVMYPPPHVVFLANFAPALKFLSLDRWSVWKINNKFKLCEIDVTKDSSSCDVTTL